VQIDFQSSIKITSTDNFKNRMYANRPKMGLFCQSTSHLKKYFNVGVNASVNSGLNWYRS